MPSVNIMPYNVVTFISELKEFILTKRIKMQYLKMEQSLSLSFTVYDFNFVSSVII
jgi:hypothetical protein